jgi:hypothetical protein
MSFENSIKEWVKIDNQYKIMNHQLKELREKKNQAYDNISDYVETHSLTNKIIEISDGRLKFANTQTTQSLTLGYIERCLTEIIKNPDQVKTIMNHIKNNREIKINSEIKRYYNNN